MSAPVPTGQSTNSALDADGLRIWSCVLCRRRKVRCNRREPCANCTRNNVECHYPVTGRIPRRRGLPLNMKSSAGDKQSELINRLRRLESIVTELSAQVEEGTGDQQGGGSLPWQMALRPQQDGAAPSTSTTESTDTSNGEVDEDFGRLVVAKDGVLHVGHQVWTVFCDEVHNIFNAIEDVEFSHPIAGPESDVPQAAEHHGYIFGMQQPNLDDDAAARLHPLPSQIMFLWQTYLDNVDPFIKILDTTAVTKTIHSLGLETGPEMESMVLAISLAAIVSLSDQDVVVNFAQPKAQILKNYRLGTEAALARSEFLVSKSLTVVQAFVIYLSVLPHAGLRQAAWPLTGLLLRVATALGLHRDGSHQPQMSFLEAEMRRRLWWQICLVDSTSRDPHTPHLSISEAMFDTAMPANMDDKDLALAGPRWTASEVSKTATTATLFLIRCHIWRLGRTIEANKDKTLETQLGLMHSARSVIQSTYIANLDKSKAFDLFVELMTALFFARMDSIVYGQALKREANKNSNGDSVAPIQHHLFNASLTIIDAVYRIKTRADWTKWRWQIQGHFPWHAMGTVLSQLCQTTTWSPESERAWDSAKRLFDYSVHENDTNGTLAGKLRDLVAKTGTHRELQVSVAREPSSSLQPGRQSPGLSTGSWDSPGDGWMMEEFIDLDPSLFPDLGSL